MTAALQSLLRQRFVRFLLTGVLNTGFSYGLYVVLLAAGLPYVAANLLATVAGIAFSFRTQGRFVFGNTDGRLIVRYVACWLVIWGINIGVIHLLVQAGLDAYSAGALALLPTVLASYMLQKALVFGGGVRTR